MPNRKRSFQTMRNKGFSDAQRAYMYGIAKQASREMEQDATERAFLYMLAIPLNVLAELGYVTHDNADEYIREVISLYKSVEAGVVTDKDLANLLYEYAGITITADWMNKLTGETNEDRVN